MRIYLKPIQKVKKGKKTVHQREASRINQVTQVAGCARTGGITDSSRNLKTCLSR